MSAPDLEGPDWEEAFRYAEAPERACRHVRGHRPDEDSACWRGLAAHGFTRGDVVRVIAGQDGEPHRRPWLVVLELADGRFAVLRATCCGVGWRCHRDGSSVVARSLEDLVKYGLEEGECRALGFGW